MALGAGCGSFSQDLPPGPETHETETALKNGDVVDNGRMVYAYQQDFYRNQVLKGKTEITPELMLFFQDYFSKNGNELRLLPEFAFGQVPAWDDLSHYIIFNAQEDFVDGSISEGNFDRQVRRFFGPIRYTPQAGKGLIHENAKYTVRYGSDAHGWAIYELTGLKNKGKINQDLDRWEATIRGYFFNELDSDPTAEGCSNNGKAVWKEMKKEENKGLTYWQVQNNLILKDPGSVLELGCEWTIEFTVNDPEGDIYFTYLSCSKNPKEEPATRRIPSDMPPDIYLFKQYPSGYEFIRTVSGLRGEVEITNELREKFNLFARDYRWCYLPDLDGHESFFETGDGYANSLGYSNFADAVFYALSYLRFPEKVSEQTVQSTLAALFVAKDGVHRPMPHQAYFKIANYADGYYSPWPEGTPNYDRMFFLLTGLKVEEQESGEVYITVRAKQYYFEDPSYAPGENEKWLKEKANELGLSDLEAAAKLIAENKMDGIKGEKEYETTLVYMLKGTVPEDYAPRIVFSRSRSMEYDEPFDRLK
ncbi:MAG TPA: hypothetical protein GXX46_05225 [Peptococcaceae bacterium]|nr:hypothetical protein [Peptococcaceae bacterium]